MQARPWLAGVADSGAFFVVTCDGSRLDESSALRAADRLAILVKFMKNQFEAGGFMIFSSNRRMSKNKFLPKMPVSSWVGAINLPRQVKPVRLALWLAGMLALQSGLAHAEPMPPVGESQGVLIRQVRIEGNTLLPDAALEPMWRGLPGSRRSLADLHRVSAEIQAAYRAAGYAGVLAFFPEQALDSGELVIRVLEGKLAEVRVAGQRHFEPANLRAGLPNLREGETPHVRAIDRDIQMSNENPAKALKVTLTAGAQPGAVDAEVEVQDRDPVQYGLGLDNSGHPATGRGRVTLGVQHANLSGHDDVLGVQYQTSTSHPDQVSVFGLGYRLPLYAQATALDFFYASSDISGVSTQTPAGTLHFAGAGKVLGWRATRHLERLDDYDQRLAFGIDGRDYDNACSHEILGPAACAGAGRDYSVLPLSLSYTGQRQGAQTAWGINATLVANAGGSSRAVLEAVRPGVQPHYAITRLAAFVENPIARGYTWQARFDAQLTPDALVPGEQFGLGGAASVRGYAEREIAGDQGYALRLDLLGPSWGQDGFTLRPLLFVDHGRVSNHKGLLCDNRDSACALTGAGAGLRLGVGKSTTASLDVARAFDDALSTQAGHARWHFALHFAF